MTTTIRSSLPTAATLPARPPATADAQQAEHYRRGHEEGTTWARDFATVDELRGFVADFEPGEDGGVGDQYWRGFFAAAQEVLDAFSRADAARSPGTVRTLAGPAK
jgi:hypothetical protein